MKSDSLESKLNSSDWKEMMKMTIDIKDVKRFWLVPVGIGADRELVIEIGEGKSYQYKKNYESERFYNYLRGSNDFAEFAGKYIRKSIIQKIELQGALANPSILLNIKGYKNPLRIGSDLRVSRSDIGMIDTFHFLKKLFNK
jgi:hypothetical protein